MCIYKCISYSKQISCLTNPFHPNLVVVFVARIDEATSKQCLTLLDYTVFQAIYKRQGLVFFLVLMSNDLRKVLHRHAYRTKALEYCLGQVTKDGLWPGPLTAQVKCVGLGRYALRATRLDCYTWGCDANLAGTQYLCAYCELHHAPKEWIFGILNTATCTRIFTRITLLQNP